MQLYGLEVRRAVEFRPRGRDVVRRGPAQPGWGVVPRDKDCNKEINGLRSVVERAISHVKSWRIFHTDYRRPLHTFVQAFRTTRALYFFSTLFDKPQATKGGSLTLLL